MDKLTDLELCKRIAEIEAETFVNYFGDPFVQNGILTKPYNPLTEKALLWDLMIKYNVTLENYESLHYASIERITRRADSDKDAPRAILECIVEAKNV